MPLTITVPEVELFDPKTQTFFYTKGAKLTLEHSLVSLSKWEQKWEKPFINQEHTVEEFNDYIRCMTITQNVDPDVYKNIPDDIRKQIQTYMERKMSAAIIKDEPAAKQSTRFLTADLIYAWMVELRVPFECQKWHLNRLLTLIRIVNIDQKPPKKGNKAASAREHHSINQARRARRGKR